MLKTLISGSTCIQGDQKTTDSMYQVGSSSLARLKIKRGKGRYQQVPHDDATTALDGFVRVYRLDYSSRRVNIGTDAPAKDNGYAFIV